jgi:transposase-like protein
MGVLARASSYTSARRGRRSRESPQFERYTREQKEMILRAYQERPSMRGIQRTFGVSRPTLASWLKRPSVA